MVQTEIKLFKHALGLNHCGYTSKHYATAGSFIQAGNLYGAKTQLPY